MLGKDVNIKLFSPGAENSPTVKMTAFVDELDSKKYSFIKQNNCQKKKQKKSDYENILFGSE